MANQPDEVRPEKDASGLSHKPEDSLPKDAPVESTESAPVVTPSNSDGASTKSEDSHAAEPQDVPSVSGGSQPSPDVTPETDPYHQEEYYHHQDDYHREHEESHQHDQYGGGAAVYAGGGSSYGGDEPPRDGGNGGGDEDEGGPVKSFLDHLEDLRWMLIKVCAAVGVGMIICLVAGNYLMEILKRPLHQAEFVTWNRDTRAVALMVGTNVWGRFVIGKDELTPIDFGTNRISALQIVPVPMGTNRLLAFAPSTNKPPDTLTDLINLGPVGGFYIAMQLAIYGGIVLASPLVIYYLAQFLLPALKIKEKKYVLRGFAIGTFLFMLGVSFCYFVLMPFALNASAKYSNWLGLSANQWTAELYLSFVCKFMLGMGLGFELPVVILVLVKIGIVNHRQLAAFRRYMIVINLILGAVLTTPEVLTQVMMAIPLQILYEISVWIAWYWERKDRKRAEQLGES